MIFQSVCKSLTQTPSLLGHSHLPPTPIKTIKINKPSDQNEMFWLMLSCLVLTQAWWYQTQHTAEERCSHLILKTNIDNQLPPPTPSLWGQPLPVQGQLENNLETFLGFPLPYFFPWNIILEFIPFLRERQKSSSISMEKERQNKIGPEATRCVTVHNPLHNYTTTG